MEEKNIKYYLYKDHCNTSEIKVLEEDELLKQLQEAVFFSKDDHSEDEICAVIGMMLMHYQAVAKNELTPKNKCTLKTKEPKQNNPLQPEQATTNEQSTHNFRPDMMIQHKANNDSNYSTLLASCRNILKEFMTQNGYFSI